jgi:hypothetical protein
MAESVGVETRNAKKKRERQQSSLSVANAPCSTTPPRGLRSPAGNFLQRGRAPRAWERNLEYTTGPVPTWSETSTWGGFGARRPAPAMPRIRHPEKGKQIAGRENPDTSAQEVAESNAPGQTVFDQRFAQGLDPITGQEPLQEVTGGAMDTGLSGAGGPESTAEVVAGEGVLGKPKTTTSQKKKGQ